MTNATNEEFSTEDEAAKQQARETDHVSDPALNTESGHDWSDEGGATENGPATGTDSAPER